MKLETTTEQLNFDSAKLPAEKPPLQVRLIDRLMKRYEDLQSEPDSVTRAEEMRSLLKKIERLYELRESGLVDKTSSREILRAENALLSRAITIRGGVGRIRISPDGEFVIVNRALPESEGGGQYYASLLRLKPFTGSAPAPESVEQSVLRGGASAMDFSPCGNFAVVANSSLKVLALSRRLSGDDIVETDSLSLQDWRVAEVKFSPDGKSLAVRLKDENPAAQLDWNYQSANKLLLFSLSENGKLTPAGEYYLYDKEPEQILNFKNCQECKDLVGFNADGSRVSFFTLLKTENGSAEVIRTIPVPYQDGSTMIDRALEATEELKYYRGRSGDSMFFEKYHQNVLQLEMHTGFDPLPEGEHAGRKTEARTIFKGSEPVPGFPPVGYSIGVSTNTVVIGERVPAEMKPETTPRHTIRVFDLPSGDELAKITDVTPGRGSINHFNGTVIAGSQVSVSADARWLAVASLQTGDSPGEDTHTVLALFEI